MRVVCLLLALIAVAQAAASVGCDPSCATGTECVQRAVPVPPPPCEHPDEFGACSTTIEMFDDIPRHMWSFSCENVACRKFDVHGKCMANEIDRPKKIVGWKDDNPTYHVCGGDCMAIRLRQVPVYEHGDIRGAADSPSSLP